ncbi:hypothetical protein BGZ60DRAFT_408297, partial [Tricladium varicosporioides]
MVLIVLHPPSLLLPPSILTSSLLSKIPKVIHNREFPYFRLPIEYPSTMAGRIYTQSITWLYFKNVPISATRIQFNNQRL